MAHRDARMVQLLGHTSPDTAYLVTDYPYGYSVRTSIRYWVETKEGFGQRFCSQTLNPKTKAWNKAKTSTYSPIVVLGTIPAATPDHAEGYITTAVRTNYNDVEELEDFKVRYTLDEFQTKWIDHAIYVKHQYKRVGAALAEKLGREATYSEIVSGCIEEEFAAKLKPTN